MYKVLAGLMLAAGAVGAGVYGVYHYDCSSCDGGCPLSAFFSSSSGRSCDASSPATCAATSCCALKPVSAAPCCANPCAACATACDGCDLCQTDCSACCEAAAAVAAGGGPIAALAKAKK